MVNQVSRTIACTKKKASLYTKQINKLKLLEKLFTKFCEEIFFSFFPLKESKFSYNKRKKNL